MPEAKKASVTKGEEAKAEKPKDKKPDFDVFNDPLLPDDMHPRRGSEKRKNKLGGSFGEGDWKGGHESEDEEDIAFEDLDENEKY